MNILLVEKRLRQLANGKYCYFEKTIHLNDICRLYIEDLGGATSTKTWDEAFEKMEKKISETPKEPSELSGT